MGKKGTLMSVRKDVKVIDCTIRDGGLVNNFYFDDEFVKDLYIANIAAGVDYMEFGYKADYDLFDKDSYGKWKFCDEQDIRAIVGDNLSDLKISVMADVGRTNLKRDILPKSESVIDMIRVATYINTIPAALEMVEYCHELGYETTINIMAISNANESDMRQALELIAESNVDAVYLVDSYGSIYPEKMRTLADLYLEYMEPAGKLVGIHAHNNQQLAFANTIEALAQGVSYLDATISSMGRGAGNCPMELLIGFLQNPKYKIMHILRFIEKNIPRLIEQGAVWGYDIQYLL
ncbi:MAG: aldolase catalytic domain-containing protein, partial [Firmicutes bacterium]|nr:aldolase catalytic domain-containing protein [Bacillota bacterium]